VAQPSSLSPYSNCPQPVFDSFERHEATLRIWDRPHRVVAKVEWHKGELFPRVVFIITNMSARPEGVVEFYSDMA